MLWPLDVFWAYVLDVPMIVCEMNGLRDQKKIEMAWGRDDMDCRGKMKASGMSGYWIIDGSSE